MTNDELRKAIKELKELRKAVVNEWRTAVDCGITLAETMLAVGEGMPEIEKAHTYASENADEYRAYDAGQEAMRERCIKAITKKLLGLEEILCNCYCLPEHSGKVVDPNLIKSQAIAIRSHMAR